MKMSTLDRVLLLATGLLAAYEIVVGIDKLSTAPIIAYTIAFGVLLLAGLLLIILGFDALETPVVVIVSTIIPLCLAIGLVWQHLPQFRAAYLIFVIAGFLAIVITRSFPMPGKLPLLVLATVHGIAGVTIFLLPIVLAIRGTTHPLFSLVGIGGALVGLGGLALSLLKAGKPVISQDTILKSLSGLLFLMSLCFVVGFMYG
jgi:hypothetical protein